jgi:hypothetical protein
MTKLNFSLPSAIFLIFVAGSAGAATVDLTTWDGAEGGGSWTVQSGNDAVLQTANGLPTVFYSGSDSQGLALSGEITVQTAFDDDYVGFVLGYNTGDLLSSSADYLLIDWKQGDQSYLGQGLEGLAISRVTGILSEADAWPHTGTVEELDRATNLGSTGWADNTTYMFDLIFTANAVQVFVNDILELSVTGTFSDGSFGFYNYSQGGVLYAGLTEDVAPPQISAVPLPAGLPLLFSGLLALGLTRRRRQAETGQGVRSLARAKNPYLGQSGENDLVLQQSFLGCFLERSSK